MKKILERIINLFIKILPIDNNKILFQSGRNKVDCNPYAIYKYMKENNINDFKCMWLVEKTTDVSMLKEGEYSYYRTLKAMYHQATAKYWIRSQSLGGIIKKRKEQVYVQLWHGGGAFKKCCNDCLSKEERPIGPLEHVKDWDYFVATDKENAKAMISSTNYSGKTLILGNAETDYLVNATKEDKENILSKLNLTNNKKKIILYAPTFRDDELKDLDKFSLHIDELKKLKDYLVLLRLHPLMNQKVSEITLPKNFINVGNYPNIEDLYLISDILISDYSSVVFNFALLEKPIIFYPYDMKSYVEQRGGFYLKYEELPGYICYNEKELINAIKKLEKNPGVHLSELKEFNKKYNYLNNGKVSKKIVNMLLDGKFKK